MKNKKLINFYVLLFSLLILFQGCTVYHKAGITLEEAYQANDKVKVETTVGEKLKFKYIDFDEGVYYGTKNKKGEIVKLPLDSNYIDKVRLKNKSGSTWATILTPIAIIVILLVILGFALGADDGILGDGDIDIFDFDND